jgi:SAM-dependent methyltransferase
VNTKEGMFYSNDPGSFRDRNGRVICVGAKFYRGLSASAYEDWERLCETKFFTKFIKENKIVHTEVVDKAKEGIDSLIIEGWHGLIKHSPIPFISYPYEWSFGMMKDGALLLLELLQSSLEENMILKDASAFNIQWNGSQPIFIDTPSFVPWIDGEPWIGYRQFCQMFLFPLFLQGYKNVPFQFWMRGNIEGITAGEIRQLMSFQDCFRSGVLSHVFLQAKMETLYGNSTRNVRKELKSVGFGKQVVLGNIKGLEKTIRKLRWRVSESEWSSYSDTHSYTDRDEQHKAEFVEGIIKEHYWNLVWDIGCNTGKFARLAARNAGYVIAMDGDQLVVERLYQQLKAEKNEKILPLVMNIADPSPNLGWRGLERKALPDRGRPDLVLCLALVHHLVISANIPLSEIFSWLTSLAPNLIIEFVTKDDPMVRKLLLNKEDNYSDYYRENFEMLLRNTYEIVSMEPLACGSRILYFAKHLSK